LENAWLSSLAFALTITVLATAAIYAKFKNYYEEKLRRDHRRRAGD